MGRYQSICINIYIYDGINIVLLYEHISISWDPPLSAVTQILTFLIVLITTCYFDGRNPAAVESTIIYRGPLKNHLKFCYPANHPAKKQPTEPHPSATGHVKKIPRGPRGRENSLNCERWEWEPRGRGLGPRIVKIHVGFLLKAAV